MQGVGRNPKGEGKKKGGLKVHMLIDAHSQTATYVKISEAKSQDKKFTQYLNHATYPRNFAHSAAII
jgi:Transposase DDE domain